MKRTTVVALRTQHENLGDWLIITLLIKEITKYSKVLLDIDGVPESFYQPIIGINGVFVLQREANLPNCRSFQFLKWASAHRDSRLRVILSPGHLGSIVGWKNQFRWLTLKLSCLIYNLAGVKIIRIGSSFEKMGAISKFATKLYLKKNVLIARDDRLKNLRLKSVPDLVTLLPPAKEVGIDENIDSIIISFRNDRGSEQEKAQLLEKWVTLSRQISVSSGIPITISYQVDRDRKGCGELAKALGIDPTKIIQVNHRNFSTIYNGKTLVISNRMHVALTALCLGSCGIAVEDGKRDGKIAGAYNRIGVINYLIDHQECESGVIYARLKSWPQDRLDVKRKLDAARLELQYTIENEFSSDLQN